MKRLKEKTFKVYYLGGHPSIKKEKNCDLTFQGNEIVLKAGTFKKYQYDLNSCKIEYKSEEEIRKDVTLGRLLAFGILAFGLKKKTKVKRNFLVLDTGQMKLVFNDKNADKIIETFNKHKKFLEDD